MRAHETRAYRYCGTLWILYAPAHYLTTKTQTEVDMEEEAERRDMADITVSEAGRRGGNAVKKKYGKEFYENIGSIGGSRTAELYGKEHYSALGKKGGKAPKSKRLSPEGGTQ